MAVQAQNQIMEVGGTQHDSFLLAVLHGDTNEVALPQVDTTHKGFGGEVNKKFVPEAPTQATIEEQDAFLGIHRLEMTR